MSVANKLLQAAAGGGSGPVYVDDVFSTFLHVGDSSSGRSINNGIDLDGEGGLVWIKGRDSAYNNVLYDTARGATQEMYSNNTDRSAANTNALTAFNSNGFTIGAAGEVNNNLNKYVSWTFRKQEKFFDIVTYTGNGTAGRTINHNLGSVPGMMIVKATSDVSEWVVYHRSLGNTKYMHLEQYHQAYTSSARWNNTTPTDTVFTVGTTPTNTNGTTYVAYLFAHDEQDFGENSDEAIIKCGSYEGNGSTTGPVVDLGFEPQWLLIKNIDDGQDGMHWYIFDNMRGMASGGENVRLKANKTDADAGVGSSSIFDVSATGFKLNTTSGSYNASGNTFIYMAIRRPNKPASEFAATDVFKPQVLSAGEGSDTFISTGFPVDAVLYTKRTSNATNVLGTRLTGGSKTGGDLKTDSADAEGTNSGAFFLDHNDGVTVDFSGGHFNVAPAATDTDYARYYFRRMRGFFDIVTYTSDTTYPNTFAHNLGVVPELVIVKRRDGSQNWTIYAAPSGNDRHFYLNSTAAESSAGSTFWNSTTPTASVVHVGGQDETWGYNGYDYIALLFASASGISKVGSYSGTGSSQNIDCGFSNGARFVLIKNKNNAGGWYFWDSERGITTNNDPFLRLGANDGDQNYTGDDIDPHSSGFNVSSNNNAVNKSGRDYLFLAIA